VSDFGGSEFDHENPSGSDEVVEHSLDAAGSAFDALDSAVDLVLDVAGAFVTDALGLESVIADPDVQTMPSLVDGSQPEPLLGGVDDPHAPSVGHTPASAGPPEHPTPPDDSTVPPTDVDGGSTVAPDSALNTPGDAAPITPETKLNVFNDADVGRLLDWEPTQDELEGLAAEVFPGASPETIEEIASVPTDPQEAQQEEQAWNATAQNVAQSLKRNY